MRMCEDHYAKLKAQIEFLGLKDFISKDGDDCVAAIRDQMSSHELNASNFEPLIAAYYAIFQAYLRDVAESAGPMAAIAMFAQDKCPLCDIVEVSTDKNIDDEWIRGSCADQLNIARMIGVAPVVQ